MKQRQRTRAVRLQVERLECRRLLAGLNVSVYIDQNLSGNYETTADLPAANRIVYIDLNRSGEFDDSEPLAITNQHGQALFSALEAGEYSIGLLTNESLQRLSDPVAISQVNSQPSGPDIRKLARNNLVAQSLEFASIQESRQLDHLVELGSGLGFVGAKQVGEVTLIEFLNQQGELADSMVVVGRTESLISDMDLGRVALATDQATHVFASSEGTLVAKAVLADAAAPLAIRQNHLVSADRSDLGGWIVWDTRDWLPIRRERLADSPLLDVAFSEDGDSIQALSEGAIHTAHWVGTTAQITIDDSEIPSEVRMGVRVSDDLPPITIASIPIRQTNESTADQLELRPILEGMHGVNLWFAVGNGTANGLVEVNPDGKVVYTPNAGFAGRDQTIIRVLDGVTSSELTLEWEVVETNRPPTGIIIDVPTFTENLPVGSELGFVTIIDPNAGASYRVTTSDPRFRVEHGRVILDGAVDFEQEPLITLEFLAIDEQELYSITATATISIVNVVEPPSAIFLSNLSVNEKTSNAVVGQISILNPDSQADYQVSVSDSRFAVQGDQLILLERLDRQDVETLALSLTVTDRNVPEVQLTQEFSLTVNPVYDAPRDIVISNLRVPELTPGGIIGILSTSGLPDGEQPRYEVSDDRFEVVEGVLKLRSDAEVFRSTETDISLSVTAIGSSGASITVLFPLIVIPPRSPWQNPFNPPDVNGDGRVTALDVLQVINYLNSNGSGGVPRPPNDPNGNGEPPPFHPDVNGDGRVTALDALLIINLLNSRHDGNSQAGNGGGNSGPSPEGEAESDSHSCPQQTLMNSMDATEERRKKNSQIDSELEVLLDQLANDKHR